MVYPDVDNNDSSVDDKIVPEIIINFSTVCFRKVYVTSLSSFPYSIILLK